MPLFAIIDANGVRERRMLDARPEDIPHKGIKFLPVQSIGEGAAVDPLTQIKEGPVTAILADKVTDTWTVRAKTAPEVTADQDSKVDQHSQMLLRVLFQINNDVRVLKGQSALTMPQFRQSLRALV